MHPGKVTDSWEFETQFNKTSSAQQLSCTANQLASRLNHKWLIYSSGPGNPRVKNAGGWKTLCSQFKVPALDLLQQAAWKSLKRVAHLLAARHRASWMTADDWPVISHSEVGCRGCTAAPSCDGHNSCRHQKFGPCRQRWKDVNNGMKCSHRSCGPLCLSSLSNPSSQMQPEQLSVSLLCDKKQSPLKLLFSVSFVNYCSVLVMLVTCKTETLSFFEVGR